MKKNCDTFPNFYGLLGIYELYEFNYLFGYLLRIRLAPMTSSLGKLANNQFCSQAIFPQEAMQELKSKSWSAKYLSSIVPNVQLYKKQS